MIKDKISKKEDFEKEAVIRNGERVEAINLNRGTIRLKEEIDHLHNVIYALMNGPEKTWTAGQSYDQDEIVSHYKRFYVSKIMDNRNNPNDSSWEEIKLPIIIPEDTKVNIDLSAYIKKNVFDGVHTVGGTFEEPFLNMIEQSEISYSSVYEDTAEIFRMLGASGLFATRQYEYSEAFDPKERVFGVTYNAMGQHNHPNYRGMPGTAELVVMANGNYVRSRHNDYRIYAPVQGNYLARKEIMPPSIPDDVQARDLGDADNTVNGTDNTQYEFMKNVYTDYKENCVYYLSYMEVWWETFANDDVGDNTDSFRHSTDADTMKEVLEKALYLNAGGHKNRLENIPFSPVIVRRVSDTGVPVLATLRYRINSFPVGTLSESVTTQTFKYSDGTEFTVDLSAVPYDEAAALQRSTSSSNAFKLRKDLRQAMRDNKNWDDSTREWGDIIRTGRATFDMSPGKLRELCERVPGMMGQGASIVEKYDEYGLEDTLTDYGTTNIKNAAYYNHRYSMMDDDASGRRNAHRGFNDPNLFVAKTDDSKVVDGFSYMVPLELVLRTPRENWDPFDAFGSGYPTGTGKDSDNPLSNAYYNKYNFSIPADLFVSVSDDGTDVADTRNKAWVSTPNNGNQFLMASGINIFDYDGHRKRFAIFAEYQDYSKAASDLELYKKATSAILKKIIAGTATDEDIDNLYN